MAKRSPAEEKEYWEAKKAFIDHLDDVGEEGLAAERAAAKSLGAKIRITLKSWVWHVLGFFIAPFGWAITFGLEKIADIAEADYIPAIKPVLEQAIANPDTPPEVKQILEKVVNSHSFAWAAFLIGVAIAMVISTLISAISPLLDKLSQGVAGTVRQALLPENLAISAYFREPTFENRMKEIMSKTGYTDGDIGAAVLAFRSLVDPGLLTRWKFRFSIPDTDYFELMARLGFTEDESKIYLDASRYYPTPIDLIMWQAKEVFEPEMISRYGLDDEFGLIEKDAFYRAGMDDEQILNYWRAHWEHASWMQVVEMLHRGQLTEEEVWDWFRLVEIPPFWRQKLINISWNVPTRVDVRRWWDMRTIDEARLREVYGHQGYEGKNLDDYVLWTKVYVAFPDLMARFTKGWITLDDVRSELTALGMPEDRVQEMIETKVKTEQPERTTKERDVTKAEIVKGVKKDVITREQANILLQEMGYDQAEAAFILAINIPEDAVDTAVRQRELTKTDVLKGLKAAIIDRGAALQMLLDLRYVQADAEFLLAIYEAVAAGEQPPVEREATKADIIKGVRKGLIAPEQGYSMLLDIGYSHDAATFILSINVEEEAFSPHSYMEFLFLTRWYRSMLGKPANIPPNDLILAEKGYKEAKATHDTLVRAKASENEIAEAAIALVEAEYRYSQLLALWRAETTEGQTGS